MVCRGSIKHTNMKTILLLLAALINSGAFTQIISGNEKATILRMREEEKMARDVYQLLNEKWDQQVFSHISQSEIHHMSRMKTWVDKFDLTDPVLLNKDRRGVFTDETLQKLYNELKTSGIESKEDAFRAGAKVEEVDILDLKKALAETTNMELQSTYKYLISASENHLRAFVRNMAAMNVDYKPIVMDQKTFDEIVKLKTQGMGNGKGKSNSCCMNEDCRSKN